MRGVSLDLKLSSDSLKVQAPAIISINHLVGLVVKASASRAEDPGFDSRLGGGQFSGSSHTSDFKINWRSSGYPARHMVI